MGRHLSLEEVTTTSQLNGRVHRNVEMAHENGIGINHKMLYPELIVHEINCELPIHVLSGMKGDRLHPIHF